MALLKRLLALVLLALALSPFNAPFHTAVVDNATTEQIVPVESLIALRESTGCRAMAQRRALEPDGVSITPLFDVPLKLCIVRCPGTFFRGAIARITSTGDPSLLATILRV